MTVNLYLYNTKIPTIETLGHFRKNPPCPQGENICGPEAKWRKIMFLIIVSVLGHPNKVGFPDMINFQFPSRGGIFSGLLL